jgi:hypothetical protein
MMRRWNVEGKPHHPERSSNMKGETSEPETRRHDERRYEEAERRRRKEAFDILIEAREKLLCQMSEEISSHRDVIAEGASQDGVFGFEVQEIEDRYSARLNAINSLLENLECRRVKVEHRVETFVTSPRRLEGDFNDRLAELGDWDLVALSTVDLGGGQIQVILALTSEVYPEE